MKQKANLEQTLNVNALNPRKIESFQRMIFLIVFAQFPTTFAETHWNLPFFFFFTIYIETKHHVNMTVVITNKVNKQKVNQI